jgi:hypothetical protein
MDLGSIKPLIDELDALTSISMLGFVWKKTMPISLPRSKQPGQHKAIDR